MRTNNITVNLAHSYYAHSCYELANRGYYITGDDVAKFRGKDAPRTIAVGHFREYVKKHKLHSKKMLGISAKDDFEMSELVVDSITDLLYEDDPQNNDVQELNLPDKDYDFAMMNQTFEHLVYPDAAVNSIYSHLAPKGYFYANWPVINIRHAEPLHFFTGLTVTYINYILLEAGFEIVECGAWGNQEYMNLLFKNNSWPGYEALTSLRNDVNCPCIGWVLARKR